MRLFNLNIIALLFVINCFAQKPLISLNTYKEWTIVQNGGLSNDGKKAFYTIENYPIGKSTFVLKATDNSWQKSFPSTISPSFSDDSKFLIGICENNEMLIYNISSKKIEKIAEVLEYKIFKSGKTERIAYLTERKQLVIRTFENGIYYSIGKVDDYVIGPRGNSILVKQISNPGSVVSEQVVWLDIRKKEQNVIYHGKKLSAMIFDDNETKAAFLSNQSGNNIYYYDKNKINTVLLNLDSTNFTLDKFQLINRNFRFSKDGESIFFSITPKHKRKDSISTSDMHIWSYQDSYLKSFFYDKNNNAKETKEYLCNVDIVKSKISQLLRGNESIVSSLNHFTDSLLILQSNFGMSDEQFVNSAKISYSLYFVKSGKRVNFETNRTLPIQDISISPNCNFISYYDSELENYIIYNIHTTKKNNVTKNIKASLIKYDRISSYKSYRFPVGNSIWLNSDRRLLVNSTFDIWSVDPLGLMPATCITNGLGDRYKTIFTISKDELNHSFIKNKDVIVSGYSVLTKDIGIYRIEIGQSPKVIKLSSGQYYYNWKGNIYAGFNSGQILRSKNSKFFLIYRESVNKAPNYFFSKDLRTFLAISDNQPQRKFNWLRSELHTYKDSIGNTYQGILYKPENFDDNKKYPVLFQYYERQTDRVNQFPSVELPFSNFSVPVAVSNDYLVFLPDINSATGNPGDGALKSILAAVNYLAEKSWADTSVMGIAGHSFGGFETNYIITHSKIFKAAVSSAGTSEIVSMAYGIWAASGSSTTGYYVGSSPNLGQTLIENQKLYVDNSPLFKVSSIQTPLLLIHNTGDLAVPVMQSRQFFIALRSLQKPAWWLNYDNESHVIAQENNQKDFNQKVLEFFDHYLKGTPEPIWMKNHL